MFDSFSGEEKKTLMSASPFIHNTFSVKSDIIFHYLTSSDPPNLLHEIEIRIKKDICPNRQTLHSPYVAVMLTS